MAREQMLGKYGIAIAVSIIVWVISFALSMLTSFGVDTRTPSGLLISYGISFVLNLILAVISAGTVYFFLNICRNKKESVSDIFWAFSHHPDKVILITLYLMLITLLTMVPFIASVCAYLFLGKQTIYILLMTFTLILAIIGMFYFMLSYSFVYFVFVDHYDESIFEILRQSRTLIRGHRLRFFYLILSFIGWLLLSTLSCGIGYLWVIPYLQVSEIMFYMDITGELDAPEVIEEPQSNQDIFDNLYR